MTVKTIVSPMVYPVMVSPEVLVKTAMVDRASVPIPPPANLGCTRLWTLGAERAPKGRLCRDLVSFRAFWA